MSRPLLRAVWSGSLSGKSSKGGDGRRWRAAADRLPSASSTAGSQPAPFRGGGGSGARRRAASRPT
jgi:hypothetical protein